MIPLSETYFSIETCWISCCCSERLANLPKLPVIRRVLPHLQKVLVKTRRCVFQLWSDLQARSWAETANHLWQGSTSRAFNFRKYSEISFLRDLSLSESGCPRDESCAPRELYSRIWKFYLPLVRLERLFTINRSASVVPQMVQPHRSLYS